MLSSIPIHTCMNEIHTQKREQIRVQDLIFDKQICVMCNHIHTVEYVEYVRLIIEFDFGALSCC